MQKTAIRGFFALWHINELEELVNILASSVGSLTNPAKLTRTFRSVKNSKITQKTVTKYL